MKALTLWRPWPTLILYHGKDIENRGWKPPVDWVRNDGLLAIHGGMRVDGNGLGVLMGLLRGKALAFAMDAQQAAGPTGIVGVVRVVGWCDECSSASDSEWFSGPVGWRLEKPIALPQPVPCKGAQGLWTLPVMIESAVREQLDTK